MIDLDAFIVARLDRIEESPRMWGTCTEAVVMQYITLLEVLRIHRGEDPHEFPQDKTAWRAFQRVTATPEGPNSVPIWNRESQTWTFDDAVESLKKVRAEVLP